MFGKLALEEPAYDDDDVVASSGDVEAELSYILPQDAKPVLLSAAFTGGEPREMFEVDPQVVAIESIRPNPLAYGLDKEGFALRTVPTAVEDFSDDRQVEGTYFPEIEAFLKREFAATRVAIFDATRRSDGAQGANNKDGARGPASRIHVDYTAASGPARARDVLGAEVFDGLIDEGRRIVQVNVWRPTRGPVLRSPLALGDASTFAADDLVATDQIFPDRTGEIYHVAHDAAHRWYFAPEMRRTEVLLIKGWDSKEDGRARFTPHAAFRLPNQDDSLTPRESIEVRTIVVI